MMSDALAMPRQNTLTSGLPAYDGSKRDFAADGRNADAVAVAGDAGDDAFEQPARAGRVERSEPQRVQQRDRPRAHREDVADDAADAGRRALVRLDERRVVVRLDLEDRREPFADVDRAGVLARALQHLRALGRQRLAGGRASSCSCSARTTSPRRCRARSDSARGPGTRRCGRIRRASARGVRAPADRSWLRRLGRRLLDTTPSPYFSSASLQADASRTIMESNITGRPRCRAATRTPAPDAASCRRRCAPRCRCRRSHAADPLGFARVVAAGPADRCSGSTTWRLASSRAIVSGGAK